MQLKHICLNVIAYILTAILLAYSTWFEFKKGNKIIAFLTLIMTIFVIWNAWENYKDLVSPTPNNTDNKNVLNAGTFI